MERIGHYYGNFVRALFLAGAIVMLMGLPWSSAYLKIPTAFSVIGVLVLGLAAGFTNPKQTWDAGINAVIASAGFVMFETYAIMSLRDYGAGNGFFISNIILGFIFLIAVYYSVKTLRGLLYKGDSQKF